MTVDFGLEKMIGIGLEMNFIPTSVVDGIAQCLSYREFTEGEKDDIKFISGLNVEFSVVDKTKYDKLVEDTKKSTRHITCGITNGEIELRYCSGEPNISFVVVLRVENDKGHVQFYLDKYSDYNRADPNNPPVKKSEWIDFDSVDRITRNLLSFKGPVIPDLAMGFDGVQIQLVIHRGLNGSSFTWWDKVEGWEPLENIADIILSKIGDF